AGAIDSQRMGYLLEDVGNRPVDVDRVEAAEGGRKMAGQPVERLAHSVGRRGSGFRHETSAFPMEHTLCQRVSHPNLTARSVLALARWRGSELSEVIRRW